MVNQHRKKKDGGTHALSVNIWKQELCSWPAAEEVSHAPWEFCSFVLELLCKAEGSSVVHGRLWGPPKLQNLQKWQKLVSVLWDLWRWLLLNYWPEGLGGWLAPLTVVLNTSDLFCIKPAFFQKYTAHASQKSLVSGGFERCPAQFGRKLPMAADAEVHPQCLQGSHTPRRVQMTESCLPSNAERSRKTAFCLVHRAGGRHLVLAQSPALGCKTAQWEAFPKVFQLSVGYSMLPASCGESLQTSLHVNC